MNSQRLMTGIGVTALLALATAASVMTRSVSPTIAKADTLTNEIASETEVPDALAAIEARKTAPPVEELQTMAEHKILNSDASVWSIATSPYQIPRMAPGKATTASEVAGWYLEYDTVKTNTGASARMYTARLEVSSSSKGNVQVSTLSGVPFTDCYASLSGSTLTIPAGNYCPVSNSAGETTLALCCPLDADKMVFYPNQPIVGTVGADGQITLPAWGIFVIDSTTNRASVVQANISTRLKKANGTMSGTNWGQTTIREWPVMITQTHDNRLTVDNFGNTGAPAFVDVDYNGRVEVVPQYMGTTQYGEADCMPMTETGYGSPDIAIVAQIGESNVISLPDWGVAAVADPSKYVLKLQNAKLTLLDAGSLRLPTKFPANFSGSGTQSAPYIINSYQDLMALSQLVNVEHKDQEGVYYKLGTGINCAGQKYYFTPIGTISSSSDYVNNATEIPGTPFKGHFDGGNNTISGIDYESGNRGYCGVFSWIANGGSVSNLRVDGSRFLTEGIGLGALAGINEGTVTNCQSTNNQVLCTKYNIGGLLGANCGILDQGFSTSTVMGYGNIGGISGSGTGTYRDCQARGSLTFVGVNNAMYNNCGGLTGTLNGTWSQAGAPAVIERCIAAAVITDRNSESCTGGFVGATLASSSSTPVKISESLCIATIASNATYAQTGATSYINGRVGGFVGNLWRAQITDCAISGVVMAPKNPKYCGGVIGYIMSDKDTKVENFVSACQMIVGNTTPKAANAIYSEITSTYEGYLSNVYYDKQLAGLDYSSTKFKGNLTTAEMTKSTGLTGFSTEKWQFAEGLYPQIRSLADNGAMQVAASPIFLSNDETSRMVKSNFTLSTANNVSWSVMSENGLTQTGAGLAISGDKVILSNEFAQDILCAYINGLPYLKQAVINTIPSKLFAGSGTEEDPYQIKDINDLKNLQAATNEYNMTYEGVYFKVMNDIDCRGDNGFEGIASDGVTTHEFSGTFDGGGHVIDNVVINKVNYDDTGKALSSGSTSYAGFIGRLNAKGTIKNVILGPGCRMTFWANSGGVSGYAAGRIENCVFQGRIDGMSTYIGGIAGSLQSTGIVTGCRNDGTIRGGLNYIAGIVAQNGNIVEYCQNNGNVLGDSINSFHKAGNDNYVGGIVGNLSSKTVRYCVNQGNVSGHKSTGGIYGYYSGAATMHGCVNTGIVSGVAGADLGALGGGGNTSTSVFTDNYYDGQIMPAGAVRRSSVSGCTALSTAELCSGSVPAGLNDSVFDFTAGMYPVLKAQKEAASSKALRNIVLTMPAPMTLNDVRGINTLAKYAGLVWSLEPGSASIYTISGQTLTVAPIADKELKRGVLSGVIGEYSRRFEMTTVPDMFDGTGTEQNPYLIHDKAEWNKLASLVNDDGITYAGKYFRLTSDLDFANDTVFNQIGASGNLFGGIFNGDGHTISNLKVKHLQSMALFGTISEEGAVRNLTLKNGEFSSPKSGSVTGFAWKCGGTIENCINYNTMNAGPSTSASYAAGFVYNLQGTGRIINCINYGHIMGKSGTSGGIVCTMERGSLVSGCQNHGEILVNSTQVGGIAGKCSGTIRNCLNEVDIISEKSSQVGGITGSTSDTCRIENTVNRGNITAKGAANKIGGLIGFANGFTFVSDSHNYGNVLSSSTSATGYLGGLAGHGVKTSLLRSTNHGMIECTNGQYVGGLAGRIEMSGTGNVGHVDSCFNYGSVKGGNKWIGGLFGYQSGDCEIRFSGNYGSVTGTGAKAVSDNTAGIVGTGQGDYYNCFNAGNVEAKGILTAGFISEGNGNIVSDCFNIGSVTSTGTNPTATKPSASGFWGTGRTDSLQNCYNMGAVSGKNFTSGFIGNFTTQVKIRGCYSAAPVSTTDVSGTAAPFIIATPSGTCEYADNYYDNMVCSATGGNTTIAKALATPEFMDFAPNGAYISTAACYPTLRSMAACVAGNFAAVQLLYANPDENEGNVLHHLTIGLLPGVVWSCSPEFEITGNRVNLVKKDQKGVSAWVEKQGGELTHRYMLTINNDTGVEGLDGSNVKERIYYTPEGLHIANPQPGQIVIVKTVYTDGTATVERIVYCNQ